MAPSSWSRAPEYTSLPLSEKEPHSGIESRRARTSRIGLALRVVAILGGVFGLVRCAIAQSTPSIPS